MWWPNHHNFSRRDYYFTSQAMKNYREKKDKILKLNEVTKCVNTDINNPMEQAFVR